MRVSPAVVGISASLVTAFAAATGLKSPEPFSSPELKACPEYVTPGRYPYQNPFLIDVVKEAPTTLIGDTGHERPILLSYLGEEHIIRGWAKNGVTNIDLEVNPGMHDTLAPHLSPFNRAAVKHAFVAYMQDRGLYALDEWIERRSQYFTSLMEYSQKYGIHVGFINMDEAEITNDRDMWSLYKQKTRVVTADCPLDKTYRNAFKKNLEEQKKTDELEAYIKKLVSVRIKDEDRIARMKANDKGGRRVVVFGNSHFCRGLRNVKMLLGKDAVTHVGILTNAHAFHLDDACDKGQEHDYIYNIDTDKLENGPAQEALNLTAP